MTRVGKGSGYYRPSPPVSAEQEMLARVMIKLGLIERSITELREQLDRLQRVMSDEQAKRSDRREHTYGTEG